MKLALAGFIACSLVIFFVGQALLCMENSYRLSTLMLTIIALFLYLSKIMGLSALGWVSPSSIIVFFLYFVGIRLVYLYEQRNFKSSLLL